MTDEKKQALVGLLIADWFEAPGNFEDLLEHIEAFSSLQGEEAKQQLSHFLEQLTKKNLIQKQEQ